MQTNPLRIPAWIFTYLEKYRKKVGIIDYTGMRRSMLMPKLELDNNQKSLAGEYAVLSQLTLEGYNASMTIGHTKNIDILIYNPKSKKYSKMEVKASGSAKEGRSADFGRTYAWAHMNEKHEKLKDQDLFYCFVLLDDDITKLKFFIVPSKTVANYVKKEHEFWLEGKPRRGRQRNKNKRRTFRLGFRGERYKLPTPLAKDYENRWDRLG